MIEMKNLAWFLLKSGLSLFKIQSWDRGILVIWYVNPHALTTHLVWLIS